jgi:hypothetical protein
VTGEPAAYVIKALNEIQREVLRLMGQRDEWVARYFAAMEEVEELRDRLARE